MTVFNFIDHNPRVGYARDPHLIQEFADALRNRPGEWAEFPIPSKTHKAARMLAYRTNNDLVGTPKALRGREFEATCRDGIMYVRYMAGGAPE